MSAARVAVGTVEFHLPDVNSLKGKRQIVKSLKDRVRSRFEVAVAEVDHQDVWQRATLAVACISDDVRHAESVVAKAVGFIEAHVDGMVTNVSIEVR